MDSPKPSKKLFLILGIAMESGNWKNPIEVLKAALPDFEIIALDNQGVGVNYKIPVPFRINEQVNFLKQKLAGFLKSK